MYNSTNDNKDKAPFILPDLPYSPGGLEPHITKETLEFHHGKHHNTYVINLNKMVIGTEFEGKSLEDIIMKTYGSEKFVGIFNNAAQIWNHSFYWHCMKANGGGNPKGELLAGIERDFGSFDGFREKFKNAALTQFGSGWAWLVIGGNGTFSIEKTSNAGLPIVNNQKALLTIDVWEHAYYIDYRNQRPTYVDVFLDNLVNWDFVESNLKG